ncbi:MarR family winged helix-turn-helix transcriptional regulator [Streptomyces sp. NPDC058430]|uniref:MarR family winged helix-turn-helix transcriptional regulator n=1 Tax=Streptomyces sp. NPDC058430 TaxID=3346495 RepID=UPI00365B2BC4
MTTDAMPPVDDPRLTLAKEVRFLVLAAQRDGQRQLAKALRPLGVTPAQAEAITLLDQYAPLTLAELGRYLICETGSPSRLVNSLIERGLIERESGQADRRVIHLSLTAQGRALAARVHDVDRGFDAVIATMLDGASLETVASMLRAVVAGVPSGAKVARRFSPPIASQPDGQAASTH